MKCYYRIDDGPWIKGQITSMSGGTQINFHSRDDKGVVGDEITLNSHQILFHGEFFSVTGYQRVKDSDNLLKLVSVDVSGGWVKPKR